ncbi:MAG: SpoIIE family protein phosphatase [Bacteroidia bacterium]
MKKVFLYLTGISIGWGGPCESCQDDVLCLSRCAYQALSNAQSKEELHEATLLLAYSWLRGDFVEGVPRLVFPVLDDPKASDSLRLQAILFLAQAHYKLGRLDSATVWYERIIERSQAYPFLKARAHLGLAALLAKRNLMQALSQASEASEIADRIQYPLLVAVAYTQLAYLMAEQRNRSLALQYAEKAVQAAQVALDQNQRHLLLSSPMETYLAAVANLASLYAEVGRQKEAESLYRRILSEAKSDSLAIGQAVIGLALLHLQNRSYGEVERLLTSYHPLFSALPYELRREALRLQAQLYVAQNRLAAALSIYEKLLEQAETQGMQAQTNRIEQLRTLAGIEAQEAQLRSMENARRKERLLYLSLGGIGVLLLAVMGWATYIARKRASEERSFRDVIATQAQKIQEQTRMLEQQNAELIRISEVMTEALTTVQESYAAARRLQRAIMPDIEKLISGSALYYHPMQEVSGDFYVLAYDPSTARILVAVGDATGHGISGAILAGIFSSTIQNLFYRNPSQSPQSLLKGLLKSMQSFLNLDPGSRAAPLREGADLAVGIADFRYKKLYLGLAGRPVWLLTPEGLKEFEGGRRGIDSYTPLDYEFREYEESLNEESSIFLFTDGISDALSPDGKKLGIKALRAQVESESFLTSTAGEQRDKIVTFLNEWTQGRPPNDDVTMIILPIRSLYEYAQARLLKQS